MRILISALSANPDHGSEALVGFKYVEALASQHDVVVMSSPPSQVPAGATLIKCDAGPCSFNEVSAGSLLRFELNQQQLARRLRRHFPFDVVHRVTPSASQVPTWAANLGRPLIIGPLIAADRPPVGFATYLSRPQTLNDLPRWHPTRLAARLSSTIVNRAGRRLNYLRQAKRILVGTRTALRHVPEPFREKCRLVTYSGVEHQSFTPPPIRQVNSVLRLLFVGRVIPYKGIELLLRALGIATQQCPVELDLVGSVDPVYKEFLQNLARELRVLPFVNFLPPIPRNQLPLLYQRADVFCFPTLCDTYGIALLEAMSCGCAALVSDVAGAGEIINGENGLKVPLHTPEQYVHEYAKKIIALAQSYELRRALGDAARHSIVREHDWGRIGERVLTLYEEVRQDLIAHEYSRN